MVVGDDSFARENEAENDGANAQHLDGSGRTAVGGSPGEKRARVGRVRCAAYFVSGVIYRRKRAGVGHGSYEFGSEEGSKDVCAASGGYCQCPFFVFHFWTAMATGRHGKKTRYARLLLSASGSLPLSPRAFGRHTTNSIPSVLSKIA